jgi:membrane protein CcdC involved in cytochrome C biogenesis
LDAGDLNVSADLQSIQIMRFQAMSVRAVTLVIKENLESVFLVDDLQVEADTFFEWKLAFALLIQMRIAV